MKFTSLLILLLLLVGSSCISRKQITYLQENENTNDTIYPILKKSEPYRLQINDLLSIRTKALDPDFKDIFNPVGENDPNATGDQRLYYDGFVVDPHGNIRVPILGELPVIGMTVDELRQDIEKRLLADYYKEEANIFVTVKLSGIRFIIAGEIGGSGSKIIYRDQVSIMEAIANSGGVPITGDLSDIIVIRQYPTGQKVHHIDLTNINAMNSPYYDIKPNDLILINPLPQKTIGGGVTGLQTFSTILGVVTALTGVILLFIRL